MPSPLSRRARLAAAFALPLLGAAPQEPAAPRDVVVFTYTVLGTGSDPARTEATENERQNWRYERVVTGWFEVETTRRQVGRGASRRTLIEYRFPRGGAHQLAGVRRDWARNSLREVGEGGSWADYTAEETFTAERALTMDEPFVLQLDVSGAPTWSRILMPGEPLTQLEDAPRYEGSATFEPWEYGGFGEPWRYHTDDPRKRSGPEGEIDCRYHPGRYTKLVGTPELWQASWPAAFDGLTATGHAEFEIPPPGDAHGEFHARVVVDWSVRAVLEDVELVVQSSNYDTWRPTAIDASEAPVREPGAPLYFKAALRKRDTRSKAPLPRIARFRWRLVDTSREPGVALNRPYASDDIRPDLELVAGDLTPATDDEGQTLELRADGPRSEVAVFPFDWGGFSTLRVEAQLEDGRTIEGYLLGAPGVMGSLKEIPVPSSPPGSRIATSWLHRHCPRWSSDAADDDAVPAGAPGVDGDGFTVYEEYRGVHWNRKHRTLDPSHKDLFVLHSPLSFEAEPGIALFRKLSGLAVHATQSRADLPRARANQRVVNINRARGASNGPQTALYVEHGEGTDRPNDRIPPGSRPATVPVIAIPSHKALFRPPMSSKLDGYYFADACGGDDSKLQRVMEHWVAMALFQACGVDRPGVSDTVREFVLVPPNPDKGIPAHFLVDGTPVVLEYTYGGSVAESWLDEATIEHDRALGMEPMTQMHYLVGLPGGAHSGPVECFMRDNFADVYRTVYSRDGFPVYRSITLQPQPRGVALGATRKGTGFNRAETQGGAWFGDSAAAAPANRQLVVKDGAR